MCFNFFQAKMSYLWLVPSGAHGYVVAPTNCDTFMVKRPSLPCLLFYLLLHKLLEFERREGISNTGLPSFPPMLLK